jgi:hypothetical protein
MKMLQLFESYKIIGGENVFGTPFSKEKRLHGQVNSPRGQTVSQIECSFPLARLFEPQSYREQHLSNHFKLIGVRNKLVVLIARWPPFPLSTLHIQVCPVIVAREITPSSISKQAFTRDSTYYLIF